MTDRHEELVIVGAGAAGLCAGWYGAKAGLNPLILEQDDAIGGAWRHMPDDLTCLSPARFDLLPNGACPKGNEIYAKAPDVLDALRSLHTQLEPNLALNTRVESITHSDSGLELHTNTGTIQSARLIVASGIYGRPFIPELPGSFGGRSIHSRQLDSKKIQDNERVLLVGSGNSAAEALERLLNKDIAVTVSARNPIPAPHPVHYKGVVGRMRYWASGLPIRWLPARGGCRDHTPVIRPVLYQACRNGRVELVDEVTALFEEGAITATGKKVYADTILWATGFHRDIAWLGSEVSRDSNGIPNHKEGVSVDDPRVGFLGLPCQRTRRSGFLRGFADDAKSVVVALK
jgi:putative flavoprotein involved in K+ transport